ncbi:MAG: hypothetical protein CSA39_05820 [Flavobacteriales bacterium]|nr:MAG: hypothetical protein CSA39_05820 [Flavobacteriales bacterium]
MKNLYTFILLLFTGFIFAQNSNIFWDRDFWNPSVTMKAVKEKIEAGNDPTALNPNGFDATVNAILGNASDDVIKYLLSLDGNGVNKKTHDGRTYLFWVAYRGNLPIMKYLIEKGAKTDLSDDKGYTLLLFAAIGGQTNTELYDLLIKHGASVNETNPKGTNALHNLAGQAKNLTELDFFTKQGLDLKSTDKAGHNVVDYAARSGNKEIIGQLIKTGIPYKDINKDGSNAMLVASYGFRSTNNLEFFKYLESLGISANITDNKGVNAIHNLAYRNKDLAIFDYFIKKGIAISKPDNDGNTPLINAANRNNAAVIKYFLDKKADINAQNKEGKTALANAVHRNSPEVVELLINNGADVNIIDKNGNNLAYYLVDSYSKHNEDDFNAKWELLTKKGLNLSHIQSGGNNLYHLAATKDSKKLLDKIANNKLNINAKNDNGLTPLHKAAMTANTVDIIKYLTNLGADPGILTDFDETVYDLALENELLDKNKIEFLKI